MVLGGENKMQGKVLEQINSGRYLLGVTGSIGCGKTYACKILVHNGRKNGLNVTHIDFDDIRRTEIEPYDVVKTQLSESNGLVLALPIWNSLA